MSEASATQLHRGFDWQAPCARAAISSLPEAAHEIGRRGPRPGLGLTDHPFGSRQMTVNCAAEFEHLIGEIEGSTGPPAGTGGARRSDDDRRSS